MHQVSDYRMGKRQFRLLVFENEDGWRYRVREVGLGGFDKHKPADSWESGQAAAESKLEQLVGRPVKVVWRIEK